jgi:tRNA(adenine34) deaminase
MMATDYCQRIKQKYQSTQGDSTELFNEILKASTVITLDKALSCLEQCVIEKRLDWLKANFGEAEIESNPVEAGYEWFYEKYLRVSVPKDGEIVEYSENRMVMRWWNPCPTLEACQKLGLDTREICEKVYQRPVQEFLKRINPKLRFSRNYDNIRPYAAFCEEIIELEV